MGDLTLLDAPRFVPVILSRNLRGEVLAVELQRLEAAAREGAVIVGGFVSPAERAVARRLALLPSLRLIRLAPCPLALCHPGFEALRRVAEGRTLLLSGLPEGDGRLRRDDCVRNNRWVLAIAEGEPVASPSSLIPCVHHPQGEATIDPAAIFL